VKDLSHLSRHGRLLRLQAFGLHVLGGLTYYQIAVKIGIADANPSTAAGRARTRVQQGWNIVRQHPVTRWDRYYTGTKYPWNGWESVRGARLWTHPRADAEPPKLEPTPFELLQARIADLEADARGQVGRPMPDGRLFQQAADALRNLGAALRYNHREMTADPKTGTK